MELDEYGYRVVMRGGPADEEFSTAISSAASMVLVSGHGGGIVPPGAPLPEVDTWSIFVDAPTQDEARRRVEEALDSLQHPRFIVSVEPSSGEGEAAD